MGVQINKSNFVTLDGNVIHDVVTWGIHVDYGHEIIIENNVINGIKNRVELTG
jgi:parallel beta-helix repeat protein